MKPTAAQRSERREWAEEARRRLGVCMGCGRRPRGWEVHEMERRSHSTAWAHPCNYLLLCRACHAGPFASMPHAKQLAHKLYWDADAFDLEAWLRLRDPELRATRRVTLAEVVEELVELVRETNG